MHRIRPGEPFHPEASQFLEGTHFNFTVSGLSLILSLNSPDSSHANAINHGDVLLGLTLREPAIFVLSKFGGLPWRVGHYNWWLNPPIVRPDPILEPDAFDENVPMGVVLLQAESGIVKAIRSVRPPEEFSRLLLCHVERQIRRRFDPWHYLEVVEAAVRAQSKGDVLVREAMFMGECGWEPAAHGQMASPFRAQGTA